MMTTIRETPMGPVLYQAGKLICAGIEYTYQPATVAGRPEIVAVLNARGQAPIGITAGQKAVMMAADKARAAEGTAAYRETPAYQYDALKANYIDLLDRWQAEGERAHATSIGRPGVTLSQIDAAKAEMVAFAAAHPEVKSQQSQAGEASLEQV